MADNLDKIKEIREEIERTTQLTGQQKKIELEKLDALNAQKVSMDSLNSIHSDVLKKIEDQNLAANELRDSFVASVDELKGMNSGLGRAKTAFRGLESIATKLANDQAAISRLSLKELKSIESKVKQKEVELKKSQSALELQKSSNEFSELGKKKQKEIEDALNSVNAELAKETSRRQELINISKVRIEQEERIAKSMGLLPKAVKGLGKALGQLGIPDLGLSEAIEKAEEDLRDLDKATKGGVNSFQAMKAVTSRVGENIAKQVTSANLFQTMMVASIKVMKDLDKDSEALARNMNMSYKDANLYRQELSGAAIMSNDLFITSKGLAESSMAINASLGTNIKLNDENLKTFTKLRTTAGLTNDELLGAQKLVIGTNKSLEDATGEILAQAKLTGLNNGVLLNEKEILKGIKDVSAATTLSLGKNPKAIAEAVAQAKALGMNLQQVENISSQILDFESSIQNELEAELLLGKDINLEKAREAALNNDLATVASEIVKQAGTAAEFGEMNRIQQDALAKSVGMSRDDLAQTLFVQEQLVGLSEDQAEKRQELLDQRIQEVGLEQAMREMEKGGIENLEAQAGAATKFNAIVEKIQEAFVLVGTAVMPIVDMIASMFGFLAEMPLILGAVAGALVAMKAISGVLAVSSIIKAGAELFGANAKFGPAGIVIATAGIGAMMAGIASATSKAKSVGDMMSPADGKTQVSTAEGGLFELSPNDDLVAAPGAADMMTKKGDRSADTTKNEEKGGGARRDAALISEIQTLISVNKQILAKSPVIEMNGNQVGQEINQSERAVQ